ncbi:MAG TPA: hypothetical protein VFS88_01325 [Micavibrio sp.]|nr:hypothetical protein [Micavibrio sp.]
MFLSILLPVILRSKPEGSPLSMIEILRGAQDNKGYGQDDDD